MRAILLAAGLGRRLAPMGWDKPKCLLEFAGRTVWDHTLASLAEQHIEDIVVVVGHRRELIQASGHTDARLTWIENADFATTNTIHSLWLARAFLNEDVVLCNADVLFDSAILGDLLAQDGSSLAVDERPCDAEEVKVIVDSDDRIRHVGKALAPGDCMGEFVGIARFDRDTAMALAASLRRYNEVLHERDLFFEQAVDDVAPDCVLRAVRCGAHRVVEIDTPEDVETARRLFSV